MIALLLAVTSNSLCSRSDCLLAPSSRSYVNFLPIPWRISILVHSCCSHRDSTAGEMA